MTRVDGRTPYDDDKGQLDMLSTILKGALVTRLKRVANGQRFADDLSRFAGYCVNNKINCITFNYDDILDKALAEIAPTYYKNVNTKPHWNPHSGYGFFCRPSIECVGDYQFFWHPSAMLLLKLHGSVNWYVKRGASQPYAMDAIRHHESWLTEWSKPHSSMQFQSDLAAAQIHLEGQPFLVPPVLFKSIREQPILKIVWAWAYNLLSEADEVTFVGYSMPVTDIAAGFLFTETLRQSCKLKIVNLAQTEEEQEVLKQSYAKVIPKLGADSFEFRDARDWAKHLPVEALSEE